MEFAGRTESIDKYRTAWRTFESCGELGAPFLRGVERGAPARRGAASLDSLDRGPIHYLHTVLAQRADAGLPTASAAAAVPAATSHRQVERFTRPGRSNFASRGPRTAVHCTGSGGIYTRLSRLAGRTSHAAIRQYAHPRRRRPASRRRPRERIPRPRAHLSWSRRRPVVRHGVGHDLAARASDPSSPSTRTDQGVLFPRQRGGPASRLGSLQLLAR